MIEAIAHTLIALVLAAGQFALAVLILAAITYAVASAYGLVAKGWRRLTRTKL